MTSTELSLPEHHAPFVYEAMAPQGLAPYLRNREFCRWLLTQSAERMMALRSGHPPMDEHTEMIACRVLETGERESTSRAEAVSLRNDLASASKGAGLAIAQLCRSGLGDARLVERFAAVGQATEIAAWQANFLAQTLPEEG